MALCSKKGHNILHYEKEATVKITRLSLSHRDPIRQRIPVNLWRTLLTSSLHDPGSSKGWSTGWSSWIKHPDLVRQIWAQSPFPKMNSKLHSRVALNVCATGTPEPRAIHPICRDRCRSPWNIFIKYLFTKRNVSESLWQEKSHHCLAIDKSQHLECPNPKPVGVQINVSMLN